ncbi:hypothetical protein [Nocardia xishanensis]|uniref:Uncharacterized protein n=1 Tax=Nocardia xishanensis TaxID=238964 RepID=A0ABW7XAU0_9NOCA
MSEQQNSQWSKFLDQARAGDLYLDSEEAANACLAACDQLIKDYEALSENVVDAQRVSGFGDFACADDLAVLFRSQATGENDSIDAVIAETVKVVQEMREIMQLSLNRITGQVVDHAAQISGITTELGG